jgi:flagellar biosynthesis protein FlhB
MAENFQEKTEQPTDKKLDDAKKKGQIAQSKELSSSLVIISTTLLLSFMISQVFNEMFKIYVSCVRSIDFDINISNAHGIITFGIYKWIGLVVPVFLLLIVITVGGSILQSGFMWSTESLKFNLGVLNPISGIKKMFTKRSAVELLKSIIKILLLTYIAYKLIMKELPTIFSLSGQDMRSIIDYLGKTAFQLTMKVGMIFLFLAGLDYLFQRWQHRKELMMTQQEVKEEYKEREGSPLIKSRIRSLQREMARRRMMEDVKTADVIVTNPTHYAIALKYKPGEMPAPKIVAKGAGFIAARIKEIAFRFRVPVIENKPLAQGLFHAVNIGDFIPERFYLIVAELLAEVYKRKGRLRLS